MLYLTAAHIPRNASNAIAAWAQLGGKHVVATAGAGMLDEFNQTNTAIQQHVFGVRPTSLRVDPMSIAWIKQGARYFVVGRGHVSLSTDFGTCHPAPL
jgi:hypothetical protein